MCVCVAWRWGEGEISERGGERGFTSVAVSITTVIGVLLHIQCSLNLPFFKGPAKMVDEYGEMVNPENHFF
jgi:hypothetical protein